MTGGEPGVAPGRTTESAPQLVVITGPTAAGKTRLALDLAHRGQERGLPIGIISADSVQVYRGMDVGTDKIPPEKREGVPHFLIDAADPDETFSAAAFSKAADRIIREYEEKGGAAVVTGGTGFYLRALLRGLFPGPAADPELRARLAADMERMGVEAMHDRLRKIDPESALRIHPHDPVRIVRALEVFELTGETISAHFSRQERPARYRALVFGLELDRQFMYERINARVLEMIENGLVAEVKRLRAAGYGPELKSQQALGYKQIHQVLDGKLTLEQAIELIQRDTRHYARRQLTWLRKEPGLIWMKPEQREDIIRQSLEFVSTG